MSEVPKPASARDAARESMEVAEAARETEWEYPSFVGELFQGRFRPDLVFPFPEQPEEDRKVGEAFREKISAFLKERVDPDEIDRTGEIPVEVIQGLTDLGAFRMKIPEEYGGLGFSQLNYNRIGMLVASHCASTVAWISAHQSIGVPQPLKLFGTKEQKDRFFPRLAAGELSAFALTEPEVGSDPARMKVTATPTEDGKHFLINGLKLWCTNGPIAELLVVMARTPSKTVNGKERKQITAFIVEANSPGVEMVHRCEFMGLRGIQNGLLRFTNVKVPRENILLGEGRGLKLALVTLNTGRLTLPACCTGLGKRCLAIVRRWANEREQWGGPIGKHEAIATMISGIAADTFAMEAMVEYAAALVDRGGADIRIEAAMAKLFCTETAWRIIDDTMQIRGGRGYETVRSLAAWGERPEPVERMMRDSRINRVFEGTTQIMHLFLAREALDPHMKVGGDLIKPGLPLGRKAKALARVAAHYALWYPKQWCFWAFPPKYAGHGKLARHLRFIERTAHKLARSTFYLMLRYGPALERRQNAVARAVEIGTELFAMSAAIAFADSKVRKDRSDTLPIDLADLFCRRARRRIAGHFRSLWCNDDRAAYTVARDVMKGRYRWLERGVLDPEEDLPPVAEEVTA